jgi:hypothetical protein
VYQCRRGTDVIRVVVAGQLPRAEHNALLHLFSASAEQVDYGARHYRQHVADASTLLHQLFRRYKGEGLPMSYTMADFRRDYVLEHFKDLTSEERRQAFEALPAEERQKVIEGLTAEEIEQVLQKLKAGRPSRPRKPRGKR